MREPMHETPLERGQVTVVGRCQACGETGETIALPDAPPPNQLCARCAVELQGVLDEDAADEIQ